MRYIFKMLDGDVCNLPNGNKGVCQPLLDCIWLHDEIRSHRILIKDLIKYRCTFKVRQTYIYLKIVNNIFFFCNRTLMKFHVVLDHRF